MANAADVPDAVKQCVGRFCLSVPASMKRQSETYKVQGVALEEVAWDPKAKSPWEQEWLSRLAKIEALKERRELPTEAFGTILEQRVFAPGKLKGVLYCGTALKTVGTWGAILDAGPSGLWLQIDASLKNQEEAAQRVTEVGTAYATAPAGAPVKGAFHLAHGQVALPFKLAEEAKAHFKGHPWKLDFAFAYETTFEPDKSGLMERFAAALDKSGATVLGAGMRPLRNRKREVAGLPGEEMILKTSERGKEGLAFVWTTPGEAKSGKHPEIQIELEAPGATEHDAKIALWDALLDGIQRAP